MPLTLEKLRYRIYGICNPTWFFNQQQETK